MRFEKLMADVASRTKKQTVLMSEDEDNGSEIVKFYQLRGLGGFVLIVRDDDQLHQSWNGRDRLDPATIAYVAERAG